MIGLQLFEQMMDRSEVNPGLAGLRKVLVVFGEAAPATEPSDGPLNHPSSGQLDETLGARRAFHDLEFEVIALTNRLLEVAPVGLISPDPAEVGVSVSGLGEDQFRPVTVLKACRVHHRDQEMAERIDQEMAIAPLDFFSQRRSRGPRRPRLS